MPITHDNEINTNNDPPVPLPKVLELPKQVSNEIHHLLQSNSQFLQDSELFISNLFNVGFQSAESGDPAPLLPLIQKLPPPILTLLTNDEGLSILHASSAFNSPAVFSFMIHVCGDSPDRPVILKKSKFQGYTPLHFAIETNSYFILGEILRENPNVFQRYPGLNKSALEFSIENKNKKALKTIIESQDIHKCFVYAASIGNESLLSFIIRLFIKSLPRQEDKLTPESLSKLRQFITKTNSNNDTALWHCCNVGSVPIFETLMKFSSSSVLNLPTNTMNSPYFGDTPLMTAIRNKHKPLLIKLLDIKTLDFNTNSMGLSTTKACHSPLSLSLENGLYDFAIDSMVRKADVFFVNNTGNNLIHFAALANHPQFILLFASKLVSINDQNNNGHTPISLSVLKGKEKAFSTLVELGANFDDHKGPPLKQMALLSKSVEILNYFSLPMLELGDESQEFQSNVEEIENDESENVDFVEHPIFSSNQMPKSVQTVEHESLSTDPVQVDVTAVEDVPFTSSTTEKEEDVVQEDET